MAYCGGVPPESGNPTAAVIQFPGRGHNTITIRRQARQVLAEQPARA
jgi:hypothetical protein